ncbi:MAG: TatD family deoxyribonuclease [Phycisphaerales bacterium]|nr:TatD family deoxyribonuclease [Phycisphaerales bacterium]
MIAVIDTHCHLTFPEFNGRVAEVLASAARVGVHSAITISTTTADAIRATELAALHPRLFASAGVHPLYADKPCDWSQLQRAGEHHKCVAWGELGLDNHYATPSHPQQRVVLDEQLDHIRQWTARGLAKPIVIHCRKAFADLVPILAASGLPGDRFVFHCFTGDSTDVRMALDLGAYVSFTGVVTFPGAHDVRAAAKLVPIDRIMVETDSPFLSPQPVRGAKPNEPKHVVHVAAELAIVRGEEPRRFNDQLDANAVRFFGDALRVPRMAEL